MSKEPPTYEELAELIKACAGVTADAAAMARQPAVTFADLEVDSLGVLGIVAALENRYGVRLGAQAEECQRPQQLRELIENAIAMEASNARTH